MRIFITGATGFLGSVLVDELIAAGHTVLGLARSDEAAAQLASQGAECVRGTIQDVDVLSQSAAQCDAAIHLAFIMDFANIASVCAIDRAAITAMGDALVAAGKHGALIATTATMMLQHGKTGVETDGPDMSNPMLAARGAAEPTCLAYAKKGLRASVLRIPPTAHGEGRSGLMGYLVDAATQKGVSVYVGEGNNRWSACHRRDVAKLYRLALENGEPGTVYHAVAEEGVRVKDIATEIGTQLGVPVKSISADEAQAHFGWMAFAALADNPVSSEHTRRSMGWLPTGPTAVQDVAAVIKSRKS